MALPEMILIIVILLILIIVIYNLFFKKNTMLMGGVHPSHPGVIINKKKMNVNNSSNYSVSIWFSIEDWNTNFGKVKPVIYFSNGPQKISLDDSAPGVPEGPFNHTSSGKPNTGALATNNNFAVALDAYENNLLVGIKTYAQTTDKTANIPPTLLPASEYFQQSKVPHHDGQRYETFRVTNINIQKWVCLICVVCGRTLDIYLHGKLVRSFVLPGVAISLQQDNAYIGGPKDITFHGYVARFQMFNYCLNPQDAYNIYRGGASSNQIGGNSGGNIFNKYKLKMQFFENSHAMGKPIII